MSDELTFELPEPPSLNAMLDARAAGWYVYYRRQQNLIELTRLVGLLPSLPRTAPWDQWEIVSAEVRLWMLRDPLELYAGLKWLVDMLITEGYVVDDGPSHLLDWPKPVQLIDRSRRGVTLCIRQR